MNTDDDHTMLILTLPILALMLGPALLASIVPGVRAALLEARILVDKNVVLPLADGIGLDIARIVILCGLLLALLFLGALAIRRFHARREAKAKTR